MLETRFFKGFEISELEKGENSFARTDSIHLKLKIDFHNIFTHSGDFKMFTFVA